MRNPADLKVQTPWETAMEPHQNRFGSHSWYKRHCIKVMGKLALWLCAKWLFGWDVKDWYFWPKTLSSAGSKCVSCKSLGFCSVI